VLEVVRSLEPVLEQRGRAVRLEPHAARAVLERLGAAPAVAPGAAAGSPLVPGAAPPPAPGVAPGSPGIPADPLAAQVAAFQAGLPAPVRALDHVLATPDTVARRARLLRERYRLAGAHVLLLGDRDLTSLALALLAPEAHITVVDADDAILAHVDRCARGAGVAVATRFADLRLGLPGSLEGACDLAFTDPPFTPEGVGLFLARGLEAVAPRPGARVVVCHGHGERQPELGYRVQEVVHELRLLLEAVLPAFNRYAGAEAIGSQSALHVCRPTRRTWAAVRKRAGSGARIYTHGAASRESRPGPTPDLGEGTLVGEGGVALESYLADPLADPVVLVALHPLFDALLPRVVLGGRAARLRIAVGPEALAALEGPLAPAVDALWARTTRAGDGAVVLELERRDPAPPLATLLRFLAARPRTKLANAWREGLIALARGDLTKNEARERIAATGVPAGALDARWAELPLHALRELVPALPRSLAPAD